MRIAWSGQHTRTKALPVLLKALALIDKTACADAEVEPMTVDVLGVGPQTDAWRRMAEDLGLGGRLTWHGWLPKDEALRVMARVDIIVITSLKDLTSTVTLEALSYGKPVVCIDHCGFSDVVDDTCGVKVPVGWPAQVISGFAAALMRLRDGNLRTRLSAGALKRAAKYRWDEKIRHLEPLYGGFGKKVLMSVYACSPYRGSEPGMGWHFIEGVAAENEVWAIVEQEKWQKDIEKYLAEHPESKANGVHWIFIHKPRARLLRKIWPPSYYWFYRLWQKRAYTRAKELNESVVFDVVHQVNMVGFRECGYLWKLQGPRYVWGPIGGLGYTDLRLIGLAGCVGALELMARNVINFLHSHFLLRPLWSARKAASCRALLAATSGNQSSALKCWGVRASVMSEIGV